MRKDLLAIGLGIVLSSVTAFSSFAADGPVTLRGHVPALVAQGRAQSRGFMPADTTMNLAIGLPLRNREALTNLLAQISDPKSSNFRHYLTPQEFTELFGPTEKDYQEVIAFARKNGLKVTKTSGNRMLLNVTGRASDVEKAFSVKMGEYQHPTESRQFFAPDRNPSVPAGLQIQDMSGLENFNRPHAKHHINSVISNQDSSGPARNSAKANAANPNIGSGPAGLYMGDDFRNAYAPGTTLTGAGQTVALLQFDGYFASDIAIYEGLTGRPTVALQNILLDGVSGLPSFNGGEVEVSLDIEMVIAMAPGISKILVYEGNFPNSILNQIAQDNAARQVSCSWGWLGGPNLTTDQIFQQMAAQGQTFFDASGDSDAFTPGSIDDPATFNEPSSNPYITQVGGTTLAMTGTGTSYISETVWNVGGGVGSSGGISTFYSIPSWQTSINMSARGGSATARNVPDVAMVGDGVLVVADGGVQYSVGGTSVAAPLWAGFTALANQQASLNSRPAVGFINPALYAIAASPSSYAAGFHDTTTGNNRSPQSPGLFDAVPGYDLCTGLGTPRGDALINALIGFNPGSIHISPPPPPYNTNFSALNGGNPNGSWLLFVQDDAPISSGLVGNGWILSLATADLVGTAGDLEVLMTTTNSTVFIGQPATFVVTVTNYGPSISTNVTLADDFPSIATIVSTNATQGTITPSGSSLIWNVGTLPVGSGASMTLTVQPQSVGALVNSATAQAGTPDPNPDEDTATATVNVAQLSTTLTPYLSNGTFHISIPGPIGPNITVVVQANSNLVSTNWVDVYTGAPPIDFVDPTAGSSTSRFYRALIVP